MAVMNQIQGGRWDGFLRRLFPIKDRTIAPTIAPELVGQIVVQEWEPEFYNIRDEKLCLGMATQAAVVGEQSHAQLFNPAGSGSLVIIDEIWLRANTDIIVEWAYSSLVILGFTDVGSSFRDTRNGVATIVGTTKAVLSVDTAVGNLGGTGIARFAILSAESVVIKPVFILAPGTSLILRGLATNVTINFTFFWRERAAEPSELLV